MIVWLCEGCGQTDPSRTFPARWIIFRVTLDRLTHGLELCPNCSNDPKKIRIAADQAILRRTSVLFRCLRCTHSSIMHIVIQAKDTILDGSCQWPRCECVELRLHAPDCFTPSRCTCQETIPTHIKEQFQQ